MPWKTFLARACAASGLFGVAMFAAIRLATADPGGPTRPELTYAGVLRDVDGGLPTTARTTTLTFMFAKSGVPLCTVSVPGVVIAVGGAFTANVPIASCGSGYFDGSDVTYEVAQDGEVLTPDGGVRITPVPYARFADQVGVNNDCPAGYAIANDTALPVGATLCRRGVDQIVKVGQGATAFWIDRYEANVNSNRDATGTYYFLREGDFPAWISSQRSVAYARGHDGARLRRKHRECFASSLDHMVSSKCRVQVFRQTTPLWRGVAACCEWNRRSGNKRRSRAWEHALQYRGGRCT